MKPLTTRAERLEKHAFNKMTIVDECVNRFADQEEICVKEIDRYRSLIDTTKKTAQKEFNGKDPESLTAFEQRRFDYLSKELKKYSALLANKEILCQQFQSTKALVENLGGTLMLFYQKGNYKFIIRNIPSRLGSLMNNPKKVMAVCALIAKLDAKFKAEADKISIAIEIESDRLERETRAYEIQSTLSSPNRNRKQGNDLGVVFVEGEAPITVDELPKSRVKKTNIS